MMLDCAKATQLSPHFRHRIGRGDAFLCEYRTELVEQLSVDFVAVMLRDLLEGRKCQRVCPRQRDYISGGSSSDGASSGCGSVPP
jgi:hypothetical protein